MCWSAKPPLLVEDCGQVRWIVFNQPEVHNAQDVEMLDLLEAALDVTARSDEVRVLVLAGAGPSLCSGHDLKKISTDLR